MERDAKMKKNVENKRNIGNESKSEVDNSNKDAAPNFKFDVQTLHGSDEE